MKKLFFSDSLEKLVDHLALQCVDDGFGPLQKRVIVAPSSSMKMWLLLRLADKLSGIAGFKVYSLQEAISQFFTKASTFTQIFFSLFDALSEIKDKDVLLYLEKGLERKNELAFQLTLLFIRYGKEGNEKLLSTDNWQGEVFRKIFKEGFLRLPFQVSSEPSFQDTPIHIFGFDFISIEILEKLTSFSSLFLYVFSPSIHYLDDLCTEREKKRLTSFWKKKGVKTDSLLAFENYLEDAPPLLANLGKRGREFSKNLDRFEWDITHDYTEEFSDSNLGKLQKNLLFFEKETAEEQDDSFSLISAGPSLLEEVEMLYEKIGELIVKDKIDPSDIQILAPNIQHYASIIPAVFTEIPTRIFGVETIQKSSFYQGLKLLFQKDIEKLLENRSFLKKWEIDSFPKEKDEEKLFSDLIYLLKGSIESQEIHFCLLHLLNQDLDCLDGLKSPSDWADILYKLSEKHLAFDFSDENDSAAVTFFTSFIRELAKIKEGFYHLSTIYELFQRHVSSTDIHPNILHGVYFASIDEGNILPAKITFLIGMDEDSYPRREKSSTVDWIGQSKLAEKDRYLFLQTLFATKNKLKISYRNLTPNDGKTVNPSFLIEELKEHLLPTLEKKKDRYRSPHLPVLSFGEKINEKRAVLDISELNKLLRHPWEFYLQKKWGIRLKRMEEGLFNREKKRLAKGKFYGNFVGEKELSGVFQKVIELEAEREVNEWKEKIKEYGADLVTLNLQMKREVYRNNLNNRFLASPAFPQNSDSHSCLAIRQWSLAPNQNFEEQPCQIPDSSDYFGIEKGSDFPPLLIGELTLVGKVPFSTKGYIHLGNSTSSSLLPAWGEALLGLATTGKNEIFFVKSGKIKKIVDPQKELKKLIAYYHIASNAPSPLLPEWIDIFLKKKASDFEKKVRAGTHFEDPVFDWVKDRVEIPSLESWWNEWAPLIQDTFSSFLEGDDAPL